MQRVIERAAHHDLELRLLQRDILETLDPGLGPHRKDELIPGRDHRHGAERQRLLEDALALDRDRQHASGIDHREIGLAIGDGEDALGGADREERDRLAAFVVAQDHLGLEIIRHRIGRRAADHFRRDLEDEARARDIGIDGGRRVGGHGSSVFLKDIRRHCERRRSNPGIAVADLGFVARPRNDDIDSVRQPSATLARVSAAESTSPAPFRVPSVIKRNMTLFALSQTFTGVGMHSLIVSGR